MTDSPDSLAQNGHRFQYLKHFSAMFLTCALILSFSDLTVAQWSSVLLIAVTTRLSKYARQT